jgi:uncharacterized metal-binding protein
MHGLNTPKSACLSCCESKKKDSILQTHNKYKTERKKKQPATIINVHKFTDSRKRTELFFICKYIIYHAIEFLK